MTKKKPEAAAVWCPVEDLTPWDDNPRLNDEAVGKVRDSIKRFGFAAPIVARKEDGMVIAGHTRLRAAVELGLEKVPVRWMDLDPADARMLALADNKLGEVAAWDDDLLRKVLEDLASEPDLDLSGLGWEEEDLEAILGDDEPTGPEDGDLTEPPEEPDSVVGEVYELGPHRLACGDSTDASVLTALCADGQADAVWTDPPYGVAFSTDHLRDWDGGTKRPEGSNRIANDDLDEDDLGALLCAAFDAALAHCRPGACWYVSSPPGPPLAIFGAALAGVGVWRQTLAWVKESLVLGRADYHGRFEPVFYGWKPGAAHTWTGDRKQTTVIEIKRPKASKLHPTMKPVALIEYCLRNHIRAGAVVLDPFGGSGSTLIACARIEAHARLVELDPGYCDVIRRRWTTWAEEAGVDAGPGALR